MPSTFYIYELAEGSSRAKRIREYLGEVPDEGVYLIENGRTPRSTKVLELDECDNSALPSTIALRRIEVELTEAIHREIENVKRETLEVFTDGATYDFPTAQKVIQTMLKTICKKIQE